ncbi:MAG: hypothetical protein Ct9H300mP20_21100 [Gammaproteobacteria bacterium]|nr:MAG: hypothetical protein Ct9H300mP20_21100 [Gammaproteobacteria bacterium]
MSYWLHFPGPGTLLNLGIKFLNATPDQLNCFGVPLPGDPFWTEETLSLAQLRYPKWDMTEYS